MGSGPAGKAMNGKLLEIQDLKTYFYTEEGIVRAVDGVSVGIPKGKSLGLVGESGCGKTVTALSVLRLIPIPPGKILEGKVLFEGEDILSYSLERMQKEIRGKGLRTFSGESWPIERSRVSYRPSSFPWMNLSNMSMRCS